MMHWYTNCDGLLAEAVASILTTRGNVFGSRLREFIVCVSLCDDERPLTRTAARRERRCVAQSIHCDFAEFCKIIFKAAKLLRGIPKSRVLGARSLGAE
jgi:hypothetical protein